MTIAMVWSWHVARPTTRHSSLAAWWGSGLGVGVAFLVFAVHHGPPPKHKAMLADIYIYTYIYIYMYVCI